MGNIHDAIIYATLKHSGQIRKGTDVPYIVHPMEVMQILTAENCPEHIIIAGILHDCLEDTSATEDDIKTKFGEMVLSIVKQESQEPNKTWKEKRIRTIENLRKAPLDVKMVNCADKLSNLRSMSIDIKHVGEKIWDRFNAGKNDIKWYYSSTVQVLSILSEYRMYQELKYLLKSVFDE
jgi:(p)ppGpp synthase/HD superfamily hydrolase